MPAHHLVSRFGALVARLFYRLEVAGARPPATGGPLLVVANHPNSLLDTALVTVAVGRPARFLAKAPLFTDPRVGWLVRASGAIPVYRRQDGDAPAGANDDTFRAAEASLLGGDAIALFPEGISHAMPALAPLKTGAARLALGAAARRDGAAFPIVPVGITLDDRAIFRSHGLLVVGAPVAWDDLARAAAAEARAGRAAAEPGLVRALTARIADALSGVTVSFASWEDARLVALADDVHAAAAAAAERGLDGATLGPFARPPGDAAAVVLERRRLGAGLLARARAAPGAEAEAARGEVERFAGDLRRHARVLGVLGLAPGDLAVATDVGTAVGWAARRLHLLALAALAALGTVLGWVPYRLTDRVAAAFPGTDATDVRATAKALVGAALFLAWTLLLAALAGAVAGWPAALAALVVVPSLLLLALVTGEGWRDAWRDARRFLTLRRRAGRVAALRTRQAELARRLERIVARLEALPGAAPDGAAPDGAAPGGAFGVRAATPDEAGALAALGARLFRQAYEPTHPEPELGRYLARAFDPDRLRAELADPRTRALVAEDGGGAAIGYAYLRDTCGDAPAGVVGTRPCEIVRFYVDAAWHGRGVAAALMAACEAEARRRGADVLWLQAWQRADRALAFYRRQGFAVVGTTHFVFGERLDDDYVLARRLEGGAERLPARGAPPRPARLHSPGVYA